MKEKQEKEEIYVVYVLHFNIIESIYSYKSQKSAKTKRFELLNEWISETDKFIEYISCNNIKDPTLDDYENYYTEVEDDCYIGIEIVVLDD